MIGKSLDFQVDQVFLDIEDAVSPASKSEARSIIASTLLERTETTRGFKAGMLSIRINGLATAWIETEQAFLAELARFSF
jgi:citrate lyase beta subunit